MMSWPLLTRFSRLPIRPNAAAATAKRDGDASSREFSWKEWLPPTRACGLGFWDSSRKTRSSTQPDRNVLKPELARGIEGREVATKAASLVALCPRNRQG